MTNLRNNLDFIATLFFEAGVTNWIVSPGSRNAPIVAGLIRHGGFTLHSFPDERAAAFAAMGMSIANQYPCGVICTSGTAAANFYPAVCEAFYQRVPMVVVTADIPEYLIDQWDGQTIHQTNIYEPHIRSSFSINANNESFLELESTIYEAVKITQFRVAGPVHINIALEDPIYSEMDQPFYQTQPSKPFIYHHAVTPPVPADFIQKILSNKHIPTNPKILILVGQHHPSESLSHALSLIQNKFPTLSDICSHQIEYGLQQWDLALTSEGFKEELLPDILVTVGMAMISKPLKKALTNAKLTHLHITESGEVGNPFHTIPIILSHHDADFLTALYLHSEENESYLNLWKQTTNKANTKKFEGHYLQEFNAVKLIMEQSSESMALHFGNSMSIRYASWVGSTKAKVFGNRGTSGIDGSLSTAVGYAIANSEHPVVCVLGDISFIYDAHGMWTRQFPSNLKIVVLNNKGGQIFNWIDGPSKEPKLMPFIETPQDYNISKLCNFYKVEHQSTEKITIDTYNNFITGKSQCLEIITK